MSTETTEGRVDDMSEREHKLLIGFACVCLLFLIFKVRGYIGEPLFEPQAPTEPAVTEEVLNDGN